MKDFGGKFAVVTGGGSGIGRELARQLVAEGCNVAICDISLSGLAETRRLCETDGAPQGARILSHVADVSVEAQLIGFRDEVTRGFETDQIHLLFNNAGIGGGGSLFTDSRAAWERTFNICWGGVYLGVRTFMPMLQQASEGHVVNVSSVNGFWASIGKDVPHTSYCAAKFAVKGFTEALMTDLHVNAPHVKCSVVMPGHVGTGIIANSRKVHEGLESDTLTESNMRRMRERLKHAGKDVGTMTDASLQALADHAARLTVELAPTTAARAAKIILGGVRAEQWRVLVGEDAVATDRSVRADPEAAYTDDFYRTRAPEFAQLTEITQTQ
jgi:NAD(P)-dependent dehydrogenase (short-subunit alcohol dehydrogenase family)